MCRTEAECSQNEDCVGGVCEDPCRGDPCGRDAICRAVNHRASCFCPDGFSGNPFQQCKLVEYCTLSEQCKPTEICLDRKCQDPCESKSPCFVPGTRCLVRNHVLQCRCEPDHVMDVVSKTCVKVKCERNRDCALGRICFNGFCSDPCARCGPGAICDLSKSKTCFCPEKFSGDPYKGCEKCKNINMNHIL